MSGLQRGFTLIELMIVVAIIAILAAVAMPAYQDYSIRAKMSEVVLAVSGCRTHISEKYLSSETGPGANNWGCESNPASKYVLKVETDANGVVIATVTGLGTGVDGTVLTLIPLKAANTPATVPTDLGTSLYGWICGGAGTTVPVNYLPAPCRGT